MPLRLSRKSLAVPALLGVLLSMSACSRLNEDNTASNGSTPTPAASGSAGSGGATSAAAIKDGGSITMTSPSPMVDWNPLSFAGDTTPQRQMQWPLYPHPFLTLPDTSVVLNSALLVSAEVTVKDPMTVVYKIQPKAVWSDGTPITVEDFSYTQSVQDPKKCSGCKAAFTQGYSDITSIKGEDDGRTVTMVYSKPFAQWRNLFNYILPAHQGKKYGDLATAFNEGFGKNTPAVSGGPYVVKDYQEGVSLTLAKNPKWYGNPAHLDTVITRFIAKQGEQVTALQNGEVQFVYQNPSLDTLEQVKKLPNTTVEQGTTLTYFHMGMKTTGDVMKDPALREAITKALNFEEIRKRTVGQYAPDVPLMKSAVYVPGQKIDGQEAYRDNTTALGVGAGDTDGALKILSAAGYQVKDGKLYLPSGAPMRDLTFLTLASDQLRMDIAQIAQQQLKPLGLTLKIDPADAARYSTALREGAFDIMATGTALDLGPLSIQQWYGTGAARSFGYSNAQVDKLLADASAELDSAKQVDLMNQIDAILLKDGVVMPLFAAPQLAAFSDKYRNIFINPSKYGTTMNVEEWGIAS